MKRYITLTLLLSLFVSLVSAQDKLNLDPTDSPRFTVTDKVWPTNVGEADVCLWNDDKLSALTITIDDNMEGDVPFWKSMHSEYGFNFTWFLITEALDDKYNVKNWDLYRSLAINGHQINGHDDINYCNDWQDHKIDNPRDDHKSLTENPTPENYLLRLKATTNKVNSEVTGGGNKCLTYAYPMGEGMLDEARKEYIAIRGVGGHPNHVDIVNYLDVESISSGNLFSLGIDFYLPSLLDKSSTLWGHNYYRGFGSIHFHGISTDKQKSEVRELMIYLTDKSDLYWVDGFTRVAQYSQSFATKNLVVDNVAQTEIKFTLTDGMLDSAFDFPLTVKIRVANNWANVSAIQNGVGVEAKLISYEGNSYALVKAIPDAGQVTVTGVEDADPAIITPIEDQQIQEEKTLEVGFSASNTAGSSITFGIEGKPDFAVFTDNGDNSGKIVFSPQLYDKGVYDITITADNGTSISSESFKLTVVDDGTAFTIFSTKADASVYSPNPNQDDPNYTISTLENTIIGGGYIEGKQLSGVFPFSLPEIPQGLKVIDAKFVINYASSNNPGGVVGNLDLYGIDFRSSDLVLLTDGFAGAYGQDGNATPLQDNFANISTPFGLVETTSGGTNNLIAYLNDQYLNATTGNFVFLRLSTDDVDQQRYSRMLFTTADGAEANGSPYPTLIIKFGADLSNDKKEFSNLTVYPNPVSNGQITISSSDFQNSKEIEVEVYSVGGQLVKKTTKSANGNSFQLDLSNTNNNGLYFLKINDGTFSQIKKIIVK